MTWSGFQIGGPIDVVKLVHSLIADLHSLRFHQSVFFISRDNGLKSAGRFESFDVSYLEARL
jgi:hypothetical protein